MRNIYPMRRGQRMGSINASSSAGTSAPSTNLQSTAASVASLANTAGSVAKGILQGEAAQNAINAQKNLTAALSPTVILAIIAVIGYVIVAKKR